MMSFCAGVFNIERWRSAEDMYKQAQRKKEAEGLLLEKEISA